MDSPPGHRRPRHTPAASGEIEIPPVQQRHGALPEVRNLGSTESPMCQKVPLHIVPRELRRGAQLVPGFCRHKGAWKAIFIMGFLYMGAASLRPRDVYPF